MMLVNKSKMGGGKRGEILRWLAAVKALLDVVMSVAAYVIASLLVKSGDIEENPGPRGNIPDIKFLN